MSLSAFTPPKLKRDVLHFEDDLADRSCRHHAARFDCRQGLDLDEFQRCRDRAAAAVFELHCGFDELFRLAGVQRVDQDLVFLADVAAPHLARAGKFAVVRVELLVQDQEAADLAAGEPLVRREVDIDLFHALAHQFADLGLAGQVGVAAIGQVALLGPVAHRFHVDVDEGADLGAAVTEGDRFLDVGKELELVLDVLGREHRAVVRAAHGGGRRPWRGR